MATASNCTPTSSFTMRWQNGQIAMVSTPLDLENLLARLPSNLRRQPNSRTRPGAHPPPRQRPGRCRAILQRIPRLGRDSTLVPRGTVSSLLAYHHHIGATLGGKALLRPTASLASLTAWKFGRRDSLLPEPSRARARLRNADEIAGRGQPILHSATEWKLAGSPGIKESGFSRPGSQWARFVRKTQMNPIPLRERKATIECKCNYESHH